MRDREVKYFASVLTDGTRVMNSGSLMLDPALSHQVGEPYGANGPLHQSRQGVESSQEVTHACNELEGECEWRLPNSASFSLTSFDIEQYE